MTETLSTLRKMRDYLSAETRWIKNYMYTDDKGLIVSFEEAQRACLLGTIEIALGEVDHPGFERVRDALREALPPIPWEGRYLSEFNDAPTTTHADVLALIDRAIDNDE